MAKLTESQTADKVCECIRLARSLAASNECERIAAFADMLAKRLHVIGTAASMRSGNTLRHFATRIRKGEHVNGE